MEYLIKHLILAIQAIHSLFKHLINLGLLVLMIYLKKNDFLWKIDCRFEKINFTFFIYLFRINYFIEEQKKKKKEKYYLF